ncbi:MAG: CHASE domain-containing protein [Acidimicrobiia bacterium]|nr:CHASE domain-containing protein [Acidimicrobiia bacterium]
MPEHGRQGISVLALIVFVVGVFIMGTLLISTYRESRQDAGSWLDERAEIVRASIEDTVGDLADGLVAIGAFMEVSGDVDQDSFGDYVTRIDSRLSLIGVAYVPIVGADDLAAFEAEMQNDIPEYVVHELSAMGEQAPLGDRSVYYPIELFVAGESLRLAMPEGDGSPLALSLGLDAGFQPEWRETLEASIESDLAVVSDFITLGFDEVVVGQAFVIAVPVSGPDGQTVGVLAAPMVDILIPAQLDVSITRDVDWHIHRSQDELADSNRHAWVGSVELPGASWSLEVFTDNAAGRPMSSVAVWVLATGGVLASFVLAMVAQLSLQRRSQRDKLTELERIADEKDRFLAVVSHEIRTPLTTVGGLAHELSDRPEDFAPEEIKELHALIVEQSDELGAIVEDLLVAARSDIGSIALHPKIVDVREEAAAAAATTDLEVGVVASGATLTVTDPRRLRQILRNLLTNAARYGGDEVELRISGTADWIAVAVADRGEAIPEALADRIFEPYFTAHPGAKTVGSIGLGLYISRELARLMGGDLVYEHDGTWTTFTLTLVGGGRDETILASGTQVAAV